MALPHIQQQTHEEARPLEVARLPMTIATNLDYSTVNASRNEPASQTARIAVFEDLSFAPRVIEIPFTDARETIGALAATTHTQISNLGGTLPYRIILEVCENFIHADFCGVVISISEGGNTIVLSDQGPGISHPAYAQNTGFTSATPDMKSIIRGVGAGFTIIREYLDSVGGSLHVDSNIGSGTVVTLRSKPGHTLNLSSPDQPKEGLHTDSQPLHSPAAQVPTYTLNARQKDVLGVLLKYEFVGPQLVAQTLGMGLATAHRDLKALESYGLVQRNEQKKSTLTDAGFEYVDYLSGL